MKFRGFLVCPLLILVLLFTMGAGDDTTIESDIYEHYFIGRELFDKRDYTGALAEYENILAIAPDLADIYVLIARVEYERKNYLRSTYFLVLGKLLLPDDPQAGMLLDRLKSTGRLESTGDADFRWTFPETPDPEKAAFELYGDGRLASRILKANAVEKLDGPGPWRIPVDLEGIRRLNSLRRLDGKVLDGEWKRLKQTLLEEREMDVSPREAPDEYLQIASEYNQIDERFRALMVVEDVVYFHPERADAIPATDISRYAEAVRNYLKDDPKNARGHYFSAFLHFVRQEWTEAMAVFMVAEGLKLDARYLTRTVKYMDICRKRAREFEEQKARAEAQRQVKTQLAEARIIDRAEEIAAQPEKNPDEIIYLCTLNRSRISRAVDRYNMDHIEEMDETNYRPRLLLLGGYLEQDPVCPAGGKYTLEPGPMPQCTVHGR